MVASSPSHGRRRVVAALNLGAISHRFLGASPPFRVWPDIIATGPLGLTPRAVLNP